MLKPELLALLCCPMCKADLAYDEKKSTLTCRSCLAVYEVIDDIPILLPKSSIPTNPSNSSSP